MLEYRAPELTSRLARLPSRARTAFAAACAERLQPIFKRFGGAGVARDEGALRSALDLAWEGVKGEPVDLDRIQGEVEKLSVWTPGEDSGSEEDAPAGDLADDAVYSVVYTLESLLSEDPRNAFWAAERGVNCLGDYLRSEWLKSRGRMPTPKEGFSHPLMQELLMRMDRDLRELEVARANDVAGVALGLRERAFIEGVFPL